MSKFFPPPSSDLAVAWGRAAAALTERGTSEISPLIVNVSDFSGGFPTEDTIIRQALEDAIANAQAAKPNLCTIETTANLIFPESLWLRYRAKGSKAFFEQYLKLLPRLKKRDLRNRKGTYFSRLIQHGASEINQLEHILDTWKTGTHRRSAFQIVVFEPNEDHTKQPFLGFPCLDYVTFTPSAHDKTLSVTALYAEQYLFDRGYGNYLGLCRLGRFVAEQMGLRFAQITYVASCAKLGDAIKRREAQKLMERIRPRILGEAT